MRRYPFSPEVLDALPEEIAELFRALEDKLLEEICSRLKAADELNEVTVQDIRALRAHGIDLEEIKKAIRKNADVSEEKLNSLLDDVVKRNQAYYGELADLAQITMPEQVISVEDTWAIYEQTKQEMRNLTRSMGFVIRQGNRPVKVLEPAKAYQWALDQAEMQVMSGAINYNQAISNAVRQLADSGLKQIYYENNGKGHFEHVDVAARRAVMTGVNQLCQQYAIQSMENLGTDLVETSAHLGARNVPGPNGWEAHTEWQGKVFRWKERGQGIGGKTKSEYPDFLKSTGYGTVTGLGGANCRHTFTAFIDGVMERTYTDKELDGMKPENRKKAVFEGREYDDYQATQKQREIERSIRKYKREQAAFKAAGLKDDESVARARVRALNKKYREFSKAAGLPMQPERTKVLYDDGLTGTGKFAALESYKGNVSVVGKFSEKQYVVKMEPPTISGTTNHFTDNLKSRADRAGLTLEAAQDIINNSKLVLYQPERKTFKFLADNGYVVTGLEKQIITAVPEKLRKKYRDYLESDKNGKKS